MSPPPPGSTLSPYTTLFRSSMARGLRVPSGSCGTCRPDMPPAEEFQMARARQQPKPAPPKRKPKAPRRSEEHTSELQSPCNLVCRLLLEKKKKTRNLVHRST